MSGLSQYETDAARQPLPGGFFLCQAFLARLRQTVEASAAIVFRGAPVRRDPSLLFETLKRRVERPLLHGENLVGELTNPLRNRPAVQRLEGDGLHDQQVNGALDEVCGLPHDYLQE